MTDDVYRNKTEDAEEVWSFLSDVYNRRGKPGLWYSLITKSISDFSSFEEMKNAFDAWEREVYVEPGDVLENERATLIVVEAEDDKVFCIGKFKNNNNENPFGIWSFLNFSKDGIEKVWHKTGNKVDLNKLFV